MSRQIVSATTTSHCSSGRPYAFYFDAVSAKPGASAGQSYIVDCSLFQEEDCFGIIALNLPGCASQGVGAEQAIENMFEAATGCIEAYLAAGEKIPWKIDYQRPRGTEFLRISVTITGDRKS